MSFFSRVREKRKGVKLNSAYYFEMKFEKAGKNYYICFMAKDQSHAKVKSGFILKERNGSKILSIKRLDQSNLAASLNWNTKDWNK